MAKDVSLTYIDGTKALNNISLSIGMGNLYILAGPSGSGKTSLLKLLMGVEYPTSGLISVLGQEIRENRAEYQKMRKAVGPVFQDFRLIKGRTVLEM